MKLFLLLILLITTPVLAESIHYNLSMSRPQSHYYEVEMQLNDFKESTLTVKMPVWAPGSYLVREFSRHVNQVRATDESGKALKVYKTAKNAWKIEKGKAKKVSVKYDVYCFELSVRTSFLDLTHGFVSGSSVFCYVDGHKEKSGTLDVIPYAGFSRISTPLELNQEVVASDDGRVGFRFSNFDQLVDSPIEIGNHEIFSFEAAGVKHEVAIYGLGNYDKSDLVTDMTRIVEAATEVFGQNPNKRYTFIIHNVVNGQGGLEHMNSCVLSVNRWTYGAEYYNFLSLVAHEYFHLWNVKRIRPLELGPFNYDEENYTSLLWVSEGITSYYDELLMVRAGYYSKEEFLTKLQSTINYVEGSPGSRVQSVADASFDAWIKGYRPDENSANTTMTYYSRGSMLGALIDVMIVDKSNATKCLDHFMQHLYSTFYLGKKRGFTAQEFQDELEKFMGTDLDDFFSRYVYGTETPDFRDLMGKVAVNVTYTGKKVPSFGASFTQDGGDVVVKSVRAGSAAEIAGMSVGDKVVACNMLHTDQATLEKFLNSLSEGEYVEILVARDELILTLTAKITSYERPSFRLDQQNPSNEKFYYWLRSNR